MPTTAPERRFRRNRLTTIGGWIIASVALIALGLFIASFFLDGFLRPRLEARMNSSLKGYHVSLGGAHLQLLDLGLTLRQLVIVQEAHPNPPVADFSLIEFRISWRELFSRNVVATVGIWEPRIHVNQPQLVTEAHSKTSVRDRGWQDALEAVYPFNVNRLVIHDGDVVYIDAVNAKPLHVANLDFMTDNIRNISEPNNVYPSHFSGSMTMFDSGKVKVDGRANYLMKPSPGLLVNYVIQGVPLNAVTPASQHVNTIIDGGTLSSDGSVEYSPFITNVKVHQATIDTVDVTYVHTPQTQTAEKQRVTEVGKTIQKENNRPAVNVDVQALNINNSRLGFKDEASDPAYTLFLSNTKLSVQNLNNHVQHGLSHLNLDGKFMGSGTARIYGTFLAAGSGPEFNSNIEIVNADLTALNPLLRAHGRFDVARGYLTVYSEIGVKNSQITGYVKPMFSDIQVYSSEKDKNKSLLQKTKELAIGAAAHIMKNHSTQKVASQINLAGDLKNPNLSSWQAFIEVVRNAFIKAILPGFDREVATAKKPG